MHKASPNTTNDTTVADLLFAFFLTDMTTSFLCQAIRNFNLG